MFVFVFHFYFIITFQIHIKETSFHCIFILKNIKFVKTKKSISFCLVEKVAEWKQKQNEKQTTNKKQKTKNKKQKTK